MPVIGTLTVDLVANTATFTADLGKAGNSLDGFGKSAKDAGEAMDFSMREARGSMMLMSEEFGVHIPRHLQALIAEIPGVGAAFSAMLPIVGVVAAIGIIGHLIEKHQEAAKEIAGGWESMGQTFSTTMAGLADKLLSVQQRADELRGDHLGALQLGLERIDHQTMADIIGEFKKAETEADKLLAKMDSGRFMKLLGEVDTGPAQDALQKVGTALEKIRNTDNDPAKAVAVLSQGIVDATTKFDALADAQRKAAGVIKDSPQDKFLAAHLTGEAKSWDQVTKVLQQQMSEAQARVTAGDGEKDNKRAEAFIKAKEDEAKARKAAIDEFQQEAKKYVEYNKLMDRADGDRVKELIQMSKEGEKGISVLIAGKQKEADEWVKLTEKMIQEDTRHAQVMADLAAKDGGQSKTGEEKRFQAQLSAYAQERQLLTSTGEQRIADEQKIDHKEEEEKQKHENKMSELTKKGEQTRVDLTKQFAQIAMFQNQNMAAAMEQLGKKELSDLVNNTLQGLMVKEDAAAREKLIDAGSSARSAFKWAMQGLPFPVNAVVAPIAASAAFVGAMAFDMGGHVPGTGPVPAMVHGGETVVTKALTDRVEASEGRGKGRGTHVTNYNINVKDADGFKRSQSQILAQERHSRDVAARRNR
jgi:hypothetical protein